MADRRALGIAEQLSLFNAFVMSSFTSAESEPKVSRKCLAEWTAASHLPGVPMLS